MDRPPASPGGDADERNDLNRSDSWDSGSVSSSSNGAATVASGTAKLAVTPVWKLIISVSVPALFGQIMTGITSLNEYTLLSYYLGREALVLMSTYLPFLHFLAVCPVTAMASSASQFVTRALGQNTVVVANVYLAHFFFVAICWSAICMLATLTWLPMLNNLLGGAKQQYDKSGGQPYLMIMLIGTSLLTTFNQAVNPFLLAEGRSFLAMNREVFSAALCFCLESLLMVLADVRHGEVPGTPFPTSEMYYLAVGTVVANAIISVWMILIILRRSMLDIPLKGCLKFSIKRLFPLNPAIVLRIVLFGAADWLLSAQTPVVMFLVNVVVDNTFTDPDILINHRIQHYLYYEMYLLVGVFTTAFTGGFTGILTYNLGAKKFKRIKDLFLQAFIWETVGTAVLAIFVIAAAGPIARFLTPTSLTNDTDMYNEILSLNTYALRMSAVIQPFMVGYHISSSAANSEGRIWAMICLVIARFVPLVVLLLVVALRNGDEANLVMVLPIAESCPAVVGVLLFAHYVVKYKYLSAFDTEPEASTVDEDGSCYTPVEQPNIEFAARDSPPADVSPREPRQSDSEPREGSVAGTPLPPLSPLSPLQPLAPMGSTGQLTPLAPFDQTAPSSPKGNAIPPIYQGDIVFSKGPRNSLGPLEPEHTPQAGEAEDALSPAPSREHIQSLMTLPLRDSEASRMGGGALSETTGVAEDSVLMSIMNDESMMEVSKVD